MQKHDFALLRRLGIHENQWFSSVPNDSSIGDFYVLKNINIVFPPRNNRKIDKNMFFLEKGVFFGSFGIFWCKPLWKQTPHIWDKICYFQNGDFPLKQYTFTRCYTIFDVFTLHKWIKTRQKVEILGKFENQTSSSETLQKLRGG